LGKITNLASPKTPIFYGNGFYVLAMQRKFEADSYFVKIITPVSDEKSTKYF